MMAYPLIVSVFLFIVVAYAVTFVGRRDRRLPKGPSTLPIIGNLHQIPTRGTHHKFTEWAQQYGGIYSLKIGPSTTVVITDRHLVKQLLDKRSSKYSDRPPSYVADLITRADHVLNLPYGNTWRQFRKLMHQFFNESVVEREYVNIQNAEAVQMIRDFCLNPEAHMLHPKRYSNSIAMSLMYGLRTPSVNTPHMTKLYHLMDNWASIMEPGNAPPLDLYPFLKWVPEKFLGNWQSRALMIRREMESLYDTLILNVEARRKGHGSGRCFMDTVLDQNEKLGYDQHKIAFLGGTILEGGSDTSASIILAFIHAMTKWPEVQKRAQEEIDIIIGEDRSPIWSDYAKIPYVAQCVKEAMRWRPVVPLAFPHALSEDDTIDGYHLPRGTSIIVNVWGMHQASPFRDPATFNPDNFTDITTLAPALAAGDPEKRDHYGYGAGRRLCPGIHLAERNLWLAIAKLLWAFEILPGVDENDELIEPDVDPKRAYSEGFLVCAKPFPARFRVRSEERRKTIEREWVEAKKVFAEFA